MKIILKHGQNETENCWLLGLTHLYIKENYHPGKTSIASSVVYGAKYGHAIVYRNKKSIVAQIIDRDGKR